MWRCDRCGETSEEAFDACWKCGRPRSAAAAHEEPATAQATPPPPPETRACPACGEALEDRGVVALRVGDAPAPEGGLLIGSDGYWPLRVEVCAGCRRVELREAP